VDRERKLAEAYPTGKFDFLATDAQFAAQRGQVRRAHELTMQVEDMAGQIGLGDSVPDMLASEAVLREFFGDSRGGVAEADEALKSAETASVLETAADVYARAGEDGKAEKALAQAMSLRPDDQFLSQMVASMVHAVMAMNRHEGDKAVEWMKAAQRLDRANSESLWTRGSALLMANRPQEAAQEFHKAIALRFLNPQDPGVAFAQLGLARAYAQQGDKQKARTTYQDLLALWKDADADLPALKAAKAEYAKLQ
jgi:eukaryotic-like serine/threonine-protein kinase